jgi:hypothetical protein
MAGKIYSFFILFAAFILLMSYSAGGDFCYENSYYKLILNKNTGSIRSIIKNGNDMLYAANEETPLFSIRLRDVSKKGEIHEFNALQGQCHVNFREGLFTLMYNKFSDAGLTVVVKIKVSQDSPLMYWNIAVDNNTPYIIDHIDFPGVAVPNDLVATGGTGHIFWPAQEGCLIEDMRIRIESLGLKFRPIEYPSMGWGGYYPSSTQMQYMAYYNNHGGIYLAAHDENCNSKGIEFFPVNKDGIKLDFRLFPGGKCIRNPIKKKRACF